MTKPNTIPDDYVEIEDEVMTNLDHSIDEEIAERLKNEEIWAQYSAWDFCGYVWWNRESNQWSCMIWVYRSHVETIHADTLEEIMEEASKRHGGR